MPISPAPPTDAQIRFGQLLRSIRRLRGLRVSEVAARMGLKLRTYSDFEAGRTRPALDRLMLFAHVTASDGVALALCAGGQISPALALACVENKAISVAIWTIEDLHALLSTAFGTVSATDLLAAFDVARDLLNEGAFERSRRRLAQGDSPDAPITARQLECLRWAQAGKSSNDIGQILRISPRTVDTHIAEACERLGVRTRVQAISLAIEAGLLSPRPP